MAEKEYIERDTLNNDLDWFAPEAFNALIDKINKIIRNQPTADVQEVRHGKWIKSKHIKFGNEFKCPFCDYSCLTDDMDYNFCPKCGAKMDKE